MFFTLIKLIAEIEIILKFPVDTDALIELGVGGGGDLIPFIVQSLFSEPTGTRASNRDPCSQNGCYEKGLLFFPAVLKRRKML